MRLAISSLIIFILFSTYIHAETSSVPDLPDPPPPPSAGTPTGPAAGGESSAPKADDFWSNGDTFNWDKWKSLSADQRRELRPKVWAEAMRRFWGKKGNGFEDKTDEPIEIELPNGEKIIVNGNFKLNEDGTITADYMEYSGQKYTGVVGASIPEKGELRYREGKLIQGRGGGGQNSIFDTINGIVRTNANGEMTYLRAESAKDGNVLLLGNNVFGNDKGGIVEVDFHDNSLTLETKDPGHFELAA